MSSLKLSPFFILCYPLFSNGLTVDELSQALENEIQISLDLKNGKIVSIDKERNFVNDVLSPFNILRLKMIVKRLVLGARYSHISNHYR